MLAFLLAAAIASSSPNTPMPSASPAAAARRNPAAASNVLARSGGTDRAAARVVAASLFADIEPAQILKVSVDAAGTHRVCGLLISGVKFHTPLSRDGFIDEIVRVADEAFSAAPIEEVDITTTVPISVGKGTVVAGDLAMPTSRTVFTVTVQRNESAADLRSRVQRSAGVYWNPWFTQQLERTRNS